MRTGRGRERTASRSPGISVKKAEGSPPQETISSLPRASDADEIEPAFLRCVGGERFALQGQGPFRDTGEEHHGKFQPFGAVQRHQPHRAGLIPRARRAADIRLLARTQRIQQLAQAGEKTPPC